MDFAEEVAKSAPSWRAPGLPGMETEVRAGLCDAQKAVLRKIDHMKRRLPKKNCGNKLRVVYYEDIVIEWRQCCRCMVDVERNM